MLHHKDIQVILLNSDEAQRAELTKILEELEVNRVIHVEDREGVAAAIDCPQRSIVVVGDQTPIGAAAKAIDLLMSRDDTSCCPRILHTAQKEPAYVRELVAAGLNGVLEEPLSSNNVQAILRNFLRKRNTKEVTNLVRQSSFFSEFEVDELKVLAKVAICRHFPAGETIINKDDPADRFYVLLKGEVETIITREGASCVPLRIKPGHSFGEMGPLGGEARSAFCIAVEDCYVLEIGSHILSDKNFPIRLKILTQMAFVLAERIRAMNNILREPTVAPEPSKPPPPKPEKVSPQEQPKKPQTKAKTPPPEKEEKPKEKNPLCVPTAKAESIDKEVVSQEQYDVLLRKVNLRCDFILKKLPTSLCDVVANKMHSYWTGSKLAAINPHKLWKPKWFTEGTPTLRRAFHIVAVVADGEEAYDTCFLQLPFTHRAIGLSQVGCCGTLLTNGEAVQRFLDRQALRHAINLDLRTPIDRLWQGEPCIEFLTHTALDVRDDTLFLIFDNTSGKYTAKIRDYFPEHQIVTVVKGFDWNPEEPVSLFTMPEAKLTELGHCVPKADYKERGFYQGQTFFLPDLSGFYRDVDSLEEFGYIFGTIGIFARMGPDYSGISWGSKGGAEGAVKAARARYGISGAQSAEDLASAINWADG